jgi:hypothetical protein
MATAKQLEHLRSVRALIAADLHRDAQLIARPMLEAQGTLRWPFNRASERTDLWFWYGAILAWRQMAKSKAQGFDVDPADEAELKPYVDRHGPNYYKPNVRKALKNAEETGTTYDLPEDPWHPTDWTKLNVRATFEEPRGRRQAPVRQFLPPDIGVGAFGAPGNPDSGRPRTGGSCGMGHRSIHGR